VVRSERVRHRLPFGHCSGTRRQRFLMVRNMSGPCPFCVTDTKGCRLAITGLTYQYTTSRISRTEYDKYHSIFYDEVFRLNPPLTAGSSATTSLHPDDSSIRATDELRFLLFRHWNLYDAMYHSSYVAGKLGIWRERGKKKLSGLLAKMG